MESKTPHIPPTAPELRTGPDLTIIRKGEKYTGPLPTRWMLPTSDEALHTKASATMESIRLRLDKKEQSSTD